MHSTAVKVLAYNFGHAAITSLQIGSWVLGEADARSGLEAKGETTRGGGYISTVTAGTCGVGPAHPAEPVPDDCGTRLVNYEILLSLDKGEITPDVVLGENGVREKTSYDTCLLITPPLLTARKAFTVKGHDAWTGEVPPIHGSTTRTVDSQLTFTPAKAPKAKGRHR